MNQLQIVNIVVSVVCVIIMTVLAWVTLYRRNRTEVSFTGTPVDKKEFDIDDDGPIEQLAKKFRVSKQALEYRIRNRP